MKNDALLLIGPTGAGKTPLGACFEEGGINGSRALHFDFGSELRSIAAEPHAPRGFDDREHAFIRAVLSEGLLLENEHFVIAEKIVNRFRERTSCSESDVIVLNGLPRHRDQAEDMKQLVRFRGLLVLDCTAEDVLSRIDTNAGGDRTGRQDDDLDLIRKKLLIFRERTEPLIDYFAAEGVAVCRCRVTPSSTAPEVYRALLALLHDRG